jgi:hypothetical protein
MESLKVLACVYKILLVAALFRLIACTGACGVLVECLYKVCF